ncbi:MAG TPA: CRISPR-associated endonuclease Cas2 [bacterium]|nr:CRISPR-associated endonuclease Cas2 [bacterium]
MRRLYIIMYDIADDKRLRLVFRIMRGYGDHLQYSVFRCELSRREKFEMIGELEEVIHHQEDQVLLVPLGPARGDTERSIEALGKPYTLLERHAIVV